MNQQGGPGVTETIDALVALRQDTIALFVERRGNRADGLPTRLQEHLLLTIGDRGGMLVSEVASLLGITPPTTSQLLTAMEQKGWLERAIVPQDRRRHRVTLTTDGLALAARMEARRRERLAAVLGGLSAEERAQLIALAKRLAALALALVQHEGPEGI